MRLFVGISIPEAVAARMRALVDTLRPLAPLKWSRLTGLHVTLKFIGEESPERLPALRDALAGLRAPPFEIVMRGVGWFPNERRPRVFWAGAERNPALAALAASADAALAALDVPAEHRAYSPHVTLARVPRGARVEPLRRRLATAPVPEFGAFAAGSFTLFESRHVRADGGRPAHEHHAIETFSLGPG